MGVAVSAALLINCVADFFRIADCNRVASNILGFVWLRARRDANREYRSALDVAMSSEVSLYSILVRIALVHCGAICLDDEVTMTASSTCWTRRLDANAARIVGAAVLSFFSETTVITELTPMERAMHFFWFSISFGEDIMAQC